MNIVQENKGQLEAVLKVQVKEEDYKDKVAAELKNMQRKAQMPGFRPGKVPFGMIQKMYGKSVMAEEVNKVMIDAVYQHIKENELNVLGNPLPDMEQARDVDWDTQKEFEFHYHIGLAPEVNLELSDAIEVDYYRIKADDTIVDNYLKDITRRYGKMVNPGVSEKEDVLLGQFEEMESEEQVKPEGQTHKANIYIQYVTNDETREKLIGLKPGEMVVFDVPAAVESEAEAATMIGVKKEELGNYGPLFRFTVESISRIEPAELNEELFEKAAPGKEIKTEEDFREFLREQISQQYQGDADKHFRNEVMKKLIGLAELPLPEAFLKQWLVDANKEELTPEKVESEFDGFADSFRWQLIENHLIKENNVEVPHDEVRNHLEEYFKAQMRQYGQENVEQSMLDEFVKNITSNQEEVKKVYDHLFDVKMLELYKEKLKLNEIEIGFDDFVKLVTEKYKDNQAQA
jgi:trigger factor